MKKHIKFFVICLCAFVVLCSVSCNNVNDETNAQSTSGTKKTPNMPPPPESSYQSITVEGNSFDIPDDELALFNITEGDRILKIFAATPMRKIGFGELYGDRTDMAEIINNSSPIYAIYDDEFFVWERHTTNGKIIDDLYIPRHIPLFLNYVDSYVDLFASVKATKDLEQIELLDVYLISCEGHESGAEGLYIYFITNCGEYLFWRQSTYADVNEYLFPVKLIYTIAPRLYEELRKLSHQDGNSFSGFDVELFFDMSEYIVGGAKNN